MRLPREEMSDELMCDYGGNHKQRDCRCDPFGIDEPEQHILTCSDDEVLARAREQGRDPAQTSKRVKAILRKAVELAKSALFKHEA